MTKRSNGGVIGATLSPTNTSASGIWGVTEAKELKAAGNYPTNPGVPTSVSALSGDAEAYISFSAPASTGGPAITQYCVFSSGGQTGTGSSSPVTITGLTNGSSYTFCVKAVNTLGESDFSASSSSIIIAQPGQVAFTSAGSYNWTVPSGVSCVSVLVIGGGGGGGSGGGGPGGGGLGWRNAIAVTPGTNCPITVGGGGFGRCYSTQSHGDGGDGGTSSALGVTAGGGGRGCYNVSSGRPGGAPGGSYQGGGNGGNGGGPPGPTAGGGGAGGYTGSGGAGGGGGNGSPGTGGGGGGGAFRPAWAVAGAGGGTGLLGAGSNGAAGTGAGGGGGGGSGGTAGSSSTSTAGGGNYGGGGANGGGGSSTAPGRNGAVRIIWPGFSRSFPSTRTADE